MLHKLFFHPAGLEMVYPVKFAYLCLGVRLSENEIEATPSRVLCDQDKITLHLVIPQAG